MWLFGDLLAALTRNRKRSATLRELHRLAPEQLADIGVAPDQIRQVAEGLLAASDGRLVKPGERSPRTQRLRLGGPDHNRFRATSCP